MLARFPAVAAALPALAPRRARLTFVTGILPQDVATEDDVAARAALVRVLGHAARADAPEGLRVCMLSSGSSADEIAATALGRDARNGVPDLTDEAYADWRVSSSA